MGSVNILWRRLDLPGHDACTLSRLDTGWRLAGAAVWLAANGPARMNYSVVLDADWATRHVRLGGHVAGHVVEAMICRDAHGLWGMNGKALSGSDRISDVDLGFTPATNTMPLRRAMAADGAEAALTAVWLDESDWQLKPLAQTYRQQGAGLWDYASPAHDFQARLTVNEAGLVTDYPGKWTQEA